MTALGMRGTPVYNSWHAMIQRCTNPRHRSWADYGGRGIVVCDRWRDFANFYADMGDRPAGTTLDRYPDVNGNYEPANCRWAVKAEQARNKRPKMRCRYGHKLTPENTRTRGNGTRRCLTCARDRQRERRGLVPVSGLSERRQQQLTALKSKWQRRIEEEMAALGRALLADRQT